MIAALILMVSLAALLQFFISYCRSAIAACGKKELSEQVREVAGIQDHAVTGEEFQRLVQLLGLCPEPGGDRFEVRAVRNYYRLLNFLRAVLRGLAPTAALWADRERAGCAYYAAVALDRRIAHSRDLFAEQMANRL